MDQNRDKRAIKSDRGHKRNVFWESFVHPCPGTDRPLSLFKNVGTFMDKVKIGLKVDGHVQL